MLRDVHLVKLSRLITTETELMRLGKEGLKLHESFVQSALTDNPGDIHYAAFDVLSRWRKRYKDPGSGLQRTRHCSEKMSHESTRIKATRIGWHFRQR